MIETQTFATGDRVEQMCVTCGEERGHIVAMLSKKGKITRVSCPICNSRVRYKGGATHLSPRTDYDASNIWRGRSNGPH